MRLPRRELAAPLVTHEQRHLSAIAARLTSIGIPVPVIAGIPDASFPWPWSVVPWFPGQSGLSVDRPRRAGWAAPLAEALVALHISALKGYPSARALGAIKEIWDDGLAAPAWDRAPVWIHGDLHRRLSAAKACRGR